MWSWSLPRRETELAKCVARCKTCHKIKSRDEVARGLVNGMSKLNNEKVWDIRLRVIHGESYRSIAKVYDVDFSLVGYIARREIWRHI